MRPDPCTEGLMKLLQVPTKVLEKYLRIVKFPKPRCNVSCIGSCFILIIRSECKDLNQLIIFHGEYFLSGFRETMLRILHYWVSFYSAEGAGFTRNLVLHTISVYGQKTHCIKARSVDIND